MFAILSYVPLSLSPQISPSQALWFPRLFHQDRPLLQSDPWFPRPFRQDRPLPQSDPWFPRLFRQDRPLLQSDPWFPRPFRQDRRWPEQNGPFAVRLKSFCR